MCDHAALLQNSKDVSIHAASAATKERKPYRVPDVKWHGERT